MELDDTVCYCFHVTKRKVVNFIRVERPRVASQVSDCGGAGTGCGWCVPYLKRFFEAERSGVGSAEGGPENVPADDYARGRGEYLRAGKGQAPPGAIPPPSDGPPA